MLKVLDEILLSENVKEKFDYYYQTPEFKNYINKVMPEIENCKKTKQDNPWHIYGCLDHILHSVEEMNKQTKNLDKNTQRMLAYTMFLHDIGKPECKLRRYSKLYKREIDSFFNHNKASVKIALRVLNKFNFNETEIKKITNLIYNHDIFINLTLKEDGNSYHKVLTPKFLKEEINKLNKDFNGKEMMKYLVMVGRADNNSQNPEMTKNSLHLLDVMEDMLKNISIKNDELQF